MTKPRSSNTKKINPSKKNNTAKGDATEIFVHEIIQKLPKVVYSERIGQFSDKMDLLYKLRDAADDGKQGLQVKQLTKLKKLKDTWAFTCQKAYDPQTLIVGVNLERNRFVLIFAKDVTSSYPAFSFAAKSTKYASHMFTNLEQFQKALESQMQLSALYVPNLSIYHQREQEHLQRLRLWCEQQGFTFQFFTTNGTVIDCFINGFKIQCKTSNIKDVYRYRFGLKVSGGLTGGKRSQMAYPANCDVDFFIFEIISFPNQFYIVPKHVLAEKGYFYVDENHPGLTCILIPPPQTQGTADNL